ncbi:hypothetical protein [Mycobacteroides abscessus]|uniref:hypothetical protein n=1 Tax=Mycobacteroides abscessus TaxID=36809 RepID=UPI00104274EE|nr:hypothetical protein [Mycobacteroides abscessus]
MNDWSRLATEVHARRLALDMTQSDVSAAGGPSATKIREIENLRATVLSTSKRRGLERALQWAIGGVDVALAGGTPKVLGIEASSQADREADVDQHLKVATEIQTAIKALHEGLPTASGARLHLLDSLVAVERAVRELDTAEQSSRTDQPA